MGILAREVNEPAHIKSAQTSLVSGMRPQDPRTASNCLYILVENLYKELIINCGEIHMYVCKDRCSKKGSTILEVNILMISL